MNNMNKRITFGFLFALLCLLSASITQAVIVELPLEELVKEADLIVVGTVENVESEFIQGKIFSFATISVKSRIKGELQAQQNRIVVKFPGGKIGDIGMKIEDSPDYKKDKEVIVFLKSVQGESHFTTVGACRGKFTIGEGIVLRENLPLGQFLARIEDIMKAAP